MLIRVCVCMCLYVYTHTHTFVAGKAAAKTEQQCVYTVNFPPAIASR